jgi:hypothetical protein
MGTACHYCFISDYVCLILIKMLSGIFNCCHCRTKYFGRTVTDQNSMYEVKNVLNSWNDYRSVQNFLSLRVLHKNIKIELYKP